MRRRDFVALATVAGLCAARGRAQAASAEAAVVFVHAGGSLRALTPAYAIGRPLGLGVLPDARYSVEISKDAPAHGIEALLDLSIPPAVGPAAPPEETVLRRVLFQEFLTAPGVVGFRLDAPAAVPDADTMRAVLQVARARGMWFLAPPDAGGGAGGALAAAARLGVPALAVTDDLDGAGSPADAVSAVRRLLARARRTGRAIGVGRLDRAGPATLRALLPEFDGARVALVAPSAFLR